MGNLCTTFHRVLPVLTLLIGWGVCQSSYAFDHDDYQLVFHQSGKISEGYAYGSYGLRKRVKTVAGGLSIFTKGSLIYFVERGRVTLFRPSEGIWVFLLYDSGRIRDNLDGTKIVDFSRIFPNADIAVWGIGDQEVGRALEHAAGNPQEWVAFFNSGKKTPGNEGPQVRGKQVPMATGQTVFENVENFLSSTSAAQAVPGIEATRARVAGTEAREAQTRAAVEALKQAAQIRGQEIRSEGERRFRQASASRKSVGATVCSADNRIAYIEQVAGARIKLTLRAMVVGRLGDFGEYGPYSYKVDGVPDPAGNVPIQDPHFLFLSLPKPIQVRNLTGVIWDDTQYWGVCSYG